MYGWHFTIAPQINEFLVSIHTCSPYNFYTIAVSLRLPFWSLPTHKPVVQKLSILSAFWSRFLHIDSLACAFRYKHTLESRSYCKTSVAIQNLVKRTKLLKVTIHICTVVYSSTFLCYLYIDCIRMWKVARIDILNIFIICFWVKLQACFNNFLVFESQMNKACDGVCLAYFCWMLLNILPNWFSTIVDDLSKTYFSFLWNQVALTIFRLGSKWCFWFDSRETWFFAGSETTSSPGSPHVFTTVISSECELLSVSAPQDRKTALLPQLRVEVLLPFVPQSAGWFKLLSSIETLVLLLLGLSVQGRIEARDFESFVICFIRLSQWKSLFYRCLDNDPSLSICW